MTTAAIKDPTATATEAQIKLVVALAMQFQTYAAAGAEKLTALFAAKTKGQVSGDIEKLLAAGAKKPVASAPHTPTPHAKRAPAEKASEKQVALVMRLVRRGDWFDKFDGLRQPTESEVRSMSKAKVSRLINELTSDY